jgi:hypothetical protein
MNRAQASVPRPAASGAGHSALHRACGRRRRLHLDRTEVDRQLNWLIAAADRFGAGDLRAIQLTRRRSWRPARRSTTWQDSPPGGRRSGEESSHLSASAGDFSAMSEEIAASSGQISAAMEDLGRGRAAAAWHVRSGSAARRSASGAATNAEAADASSAWRRDPPSPRGTSDVETARRTSWTREVVTTSAQQVRALAGRADHPVHRPDQADFPDQPSGAERRHRGPGGRTRPWLRRGGGRGPSTRGLQRPRRRGSHQDSRLIRTQVR